MKNTGISRRRPTSCFSSRELFRRIKGLRAFHAAPSFIGFSLILAFLWIAAPTLAQNKETTPATGTQTSPSLPDVRVEFFGAEKGYTVGAESVTLLCVVRNVGAGLLPEKTLRLRCYPLAGLDYTTGETMPLLPALAPNQAVAFRWRLESSSLKGPLIAAVLIENAPISSAIKSATVPVIGAGVGGGPRAEKTVVSPPLLSLPPRAALAVVPRLDTPLSGGGRTVLPGRLPLVSAGPGEAWISNDLLAARVVTAERRLPVLALSGREGTSWRLLATGMTLGSVRSGEDGQIPWWEAFRWREARVRSDKTLTTLTISGTCGPRWRAEWILEAQKDTAALNGRLRLTPVRTMRCYGIQLPQLLASSETQASAPKADGSAFPVVTEEAVLPETARMAAALRGNTVFGIAWPSAPPFPNWRWTALPAGDDASAPVLGAQCESQERGEIILAGATIEISFRLFLVTPSRDVRDALRFILP